MPTKAAKKTTTAKKTATKATAKPKTKPKAKAATKPKAKAVKKTVRVRALEALAKKPMTEREVRDAIGLKHGLKPTLDQEVKNKRLTVTLPNENTRATVYKITKKGAADLKSNAVR